MPTLLDYCYTAALAIAWPIFDYFVFCPMVVPGLQSVERRPRSWVWLWALTILQQWLFVAVGICLWRAADRPWHLLGLSIPVGWRLILGCGLVLLLAVFQAKTVATVAKSERAKESVRKQVARIEYLLPRTRREFV